MRHVGTDSKFKVGGVEYTLSRFTRSILNKFLDWADSVLPHPLDLLQNRLDGFPKDIQKQLVEEAIANSRIRRSVNNPDVKALMNSEDGALKILHLLLLKYQPALCEDDVWELLVKSSEEHGDDYLMKQINKAQGELDLPASFDDGDEKKA